MLKTQEIPTKFALAPNDRNPFNPTTTRSRLAPSATKRA